MADGVVEEIKAAGGSAVANYGSVTDDDAAAAVKTALDNFGRIDILIITRAYYGTVHSRRRDRRGRRGIEVHLRAYLATKHVWAQMLEQGEGGRIIMTSSRRG